MPVEIVPDTTLPMEILHKQKWKRLKATHTKMEHLSRKKKETEMKQHKCAHTKKQKV